MKFSPYHHSSGVAVVVAHILLGIGIVAHCSRSGGAAITAIKSGADFVVDIRVASGPLGGKNIACHIAGVVVVSAQISLGIGIAAYCVAITFGKSGADAVADIRIASGRLAGRNIDCNAVGIARDVVVNAHAVDVHSVAAVGDGGRMNVDASINASV